MALLVNRVDKKILKQRLMEEPFRRITLSFYRYVIIDDPQKLRDALWKEWNGLNIFGRIYLAHEGINAQLCVPEANFNVFKEKLYSDARFKDVPFKIAVEDDGKSFYKLTIKVKKKIVADGLKDGSFDVTNVGKHLNAKEFNEALEQKNTIVEFLCIQMFS